MAGICLLISPFPIIQPIHRRNKSLRCCSNKNKERLNPSISTPQPLKSAVAGLTELLRFFATKNRSETVEITQKKQASLSSIDDVLRVLESDYENAYFVTGIFTSEIYSEDCLFQDPTIQFRGTELYARNLKLLVPFFDHPSIALQKMDKVTKNFAKTSAWTELYARNLKLLVPFFDHPSIALQKMDKETKGERNSVSATWKLRTYLRLPWRPLISINGTTVYDLDDNFQIVQHAESWDVSALQAIGQIFTPNFGLSRG